jgi:hypothetical protein
VVQEEVSADHVIASEAKQSPMPSVEIASSLHCKGATSCSSDKKTDRSEENRAEKKRKKTQKWR